MKLEGFTFQLLLTFGKVSKNGASHSKTIRTNAQATTLHNWKKNNWQILQVFAEPKELIQKNPYNIRWNKLFQQDALRLSSFLGWGEGIR